MKTEKKTPKKRSLARRILTIIGIAVVVTIVFFFVALPFIVSSKSGQNAIINKINNATGGSANFSSLSMSWFSGIKLTDLSFDDKTGQTSIRIKNVQTKPHYASILSGNISFGQTIIDEPRISIDISKPDQPTKDYTPDSEPRTAAIGLPVSKIDLRVNDGNLRISDTSATPPRQVELQQINSHLNLRPAPKTTEFQLSTMLADNTGSSKITASGKIQPNVTESGLKLAGTNADFEIEVTDLNLESLESFFALAGIDMQTKGQAVGKITSQIKDGKILHLNADVKGSNIEITGEPLKGDTFKTSDLVFTGKIHQEGDLIKIENLELKADWLTASASGDMPMTFKTLPEFLNARSSQNLKAQINCDVAKLASQMPRTLGLHPGTAMNSGTLTANIEKTSDAQPKLIAQAKLENLSGVVANQPVQLSQPVVADVQITSDAQMMRFEKLNLSSSFATINCSGTTEAAQYNANINLQNFQSEMGQFLNMAGYQMAGQLQAQGRLAALQNKTQITGTASVTNLALVSPQNIRISEPAAAIDYNIGLDSDMSLLSVDSFKTSATFGQISANNSIIPLKKELANKLSLMLTAANLNLSKVWPFAELISPDLRDIKLAGLADSVVSIKPDRDAYTISTDSTNISNFEFAYQDKKPFKLTQVSVNLISRVEPTKLTATGSLNSPEIKIKFNYDKAVRGENTTLKGDAELDYKWSAMSELVSQFLPNELKLEGHRKDSMNFTSSYPTQNPQMLWANLTAKAPKIGFEKAEYMGLVFEPTEINIEVQKGILQIAPFTSKVNQGTINFGASANFNDPVPVLKIPSPMNILQNIKIDERMSIQLLQYLNPIFKDVDRVSGTANFSAQTLAIPLMGGTVRDVELDGNFSVVDLQLVSPFFRLIQQFRPGGTDYSRMQIRPTQITIKNGLVRYDNMQLEVGENPFNFVGRINLINKSIEGSRVITPYTVSDTIKIGQEDTSGRITLHMKNTYDRPELDIGRSTTDSLINLGLEQILKRR